MFNSGNRRIVLKKLSSCLVLLLSLYCLSGIARASPFGVGVFGADVPFGGQTSLTIATDGNVNVEITPTPGGTLATNTSIVTVTSTDVVGYKLYIRALSNTNLNNGSSNVVASANGSPAPLATNTWGYNTDASTDFVGISLIDALIRNRTGPYKNGDGTTVTYGLKLDDSLPAGVYTTSVVYTAVPQTQ